MVAVFKIGGQWEQATGAPTLDRLDGQGRENLKSLIDPATTDAERAAFGVYQVDITPPEGQRWTGAFADDGGVPVAVFEDLPGPTAADVNAERDKRLQGDFLFQGVWFQRDTRSLSRITGAATLAGFAMGAGAQPGNLRWANAEQDFGWISSDNTVVPMDAQTCFAFGQAAAAVETAIVFAAKALREMDPIPVPATWAGWP